jgi:ribonuclease HI
MKSMIGIEFDAIQQNNEIKISGTSYLVKQHPFTQEIQQKKQDSFRQHSVVWQASLLKDITELSHQLSLFLDTFTIKDYERLVFTHDTILNRQILAILPDNIVITNPRKNTTPNPKRHENRRSFRRVDKQSARKVFFDLTVYRDPHSKDYCLHFASYNSLESCKTQLNPLMKTFTIVHNISQAFDKYAMESLLPHIRMAYSDNLLVHFYCGRKESHYVRKINQFLENLGVNAAPVIDKHEDLELEDTVSLLSEAKELDRPRNRYSFLKTQTNAASSLRYQTLAKKIGEVFIFTDGSYKNGYFGAGYVILTKRGEHLGTKAGTIVGDYHFAPRFAEIIAVYLALRSVVDKRFGNKPINLIMDNDDVAQFVFKMINDPSCTRFCQHQPENDVLLNLSALIHSNNLQIAPPLTIKSHQDPAKQDSAAKEFVVNYNNKADHLANRAMNTLVDAAPKHKACEPDIDMTLTP